MPDAICGLGPEPGRPRRVRIHGETAPTLRHRLVRGVGSKGGTRSEQDSASAFFDVYALASPGGRPRCCWSRHHDCQRTFEKEVFRCAATGRCSPKGTSWRKPPRRSQATSLSLTDFSILASGSQPYLSALRSFWFKAREHIQSFFDLCVVSVRFVTHRHQLGTSRTSGDHNLRVLLFCVDCKYINNSRTSCIHSSGRGGSAMSSRFEKGVCALQWPRQCF